MKKVISLVLTGAVALTGVACGNDTANNDPGTNETTNNEPATDEVTKLVIGASSTPHAELLNLVKDDLLAEGVELEIKEFSDYVLMNPALANGDLDANFFQHEPFLEQYRVETGDDLVNIANIHVEPIRVYSSSILDIAELKDGDKISLPNDATNEGRALLLLETLGVIEVDDNAGVLATLSDITSNPKNIEFVELDPGMLPRSLSEVTCSIIQTNIALESGLDVNASIGVEDKNSPYANAITVRGGDENNEAIQKVVEALQSEKVKTFIEDTYDGAVVPAF